MLYRFLILASFTFGILVTIYGLFKNSDCLAGFWANEPSRLNAIFIAAAFWTYAILISTLRPRLLVVSFLGLFAVFICLSIGITAAVWMIFILLSAFFCGEAFLKKALNIEAQNLKSYFVLSIISGLALFSTFVGLTSPLKIHSSLSYFALLSLPIVANYRRVTYLLKSIFDLFIEKTAFSVFQALLFSLILFPLVFHVLTLGRPITGHDSLVTHLAVPHWLSAWGYWSYPVRDLVWAAMPKGADWLFAIGYMNGGEAGAQLANFSLMVLISCLIFSVFFAEAGFAISVIATALYISAPLTFLETAHLFSENAWTVFLVGSLVCLLKLYRTSQTGWIIACSLLLSAALACKVIAVFWILLSAVLIAYILWKKNLWKVSVKDLTISAVIFIIAGCYPYIYSYILTSNPFFPLYNNIFRSPLFDTGVAFDNPLFHSPISLRTAYDITFTASQFLEAERIAPGVHPLLFLTAFIALSIFNRSKLLTVGVIFSLSFIVLIFQFQSYLRYIYPALVLLLIITPLLLLELFKVGKIWCSLLILVCIFAIFLNTWLMPGSSHSHRELSVRSILAGNKQEDIDRSFPEKPVIKMINDRYETTSRVLFYNRPFCATLDGEAVTTAWYSHDFATKLLKVDNLDGLVALMREERISHIIIFDNSTVKPVLESFLKQFAFEEFSHLGVVAWKINK